MPFLDFLSGAVTGAYNQEEKLREESRQDARLAQVGKQRFGEMVMNDVASGKANAHTALPILRDYMQSFNAPVSYRSGPLGLQTAYAPPPTPGIDQALGGGLSLSGGPGALYQSPEEEFQEQTDWLIGREDATSGASLKRWRDQLPDQIALLRSLGVPSDVARNVLLAQKFGEGVLGIKGTTMTYWNPATKSVFYGRRDPMMGGIVNEATGDLINGATPVKIDERYDYQGRSVTYINELDNSILGTIKGIGPPSQGYVQQPYVVPWAGGRVLPNGTFQPIPGMPQQPQPQETNTEVENLRFRWNEAQQEVAARMLVTKSDSNLEDPEDTLRRRAGYQAQVAAEHGFPSWAAFQAAAMTGSNRQSRVVGGLTVSHDQKDPRLTQPSQPGVQAAPGTGLPSGTTETRKPPTVGERRQGINPQTGQSEIRVWNGQAWVRQ